ncbi:hypothetical protein DPEC_G00346770 [Dallia pectoralis]|uniref:Uncharacterized protein n=1 Tax=Dallia pectoralis TaxID=75939 RepID=A0ACC2F3Q4_DALPE|nr:hypothetical protein DPEC_G00346770 [Dallia pectoralis]
MGVSIIKQPESDRSSAQACPTIHLLWNSNTQLGSMSSPRLAVCSATPRPPYRHDYTPAAVPLCHGHSGPPSSAQRKEFS